jgi:phosphoribosylformylglycinamidine synthase
LNTVHGLLRGTAPSIDLAGEKALQQLLVEVIGAGWAKSAHDCSDGGLAVTLAECCFDSGATGVTVSVPAASSDGGVDTMAATMFGESASRAVISADPAHTADILAAAQRLGVPAAKIGVTGGRDISISIDGHGVVILCAVLEAEACWSNGLTKWFGGSAA